MTASSVPSLHQSSAPPGIRTTTSNDSLHRETFSISAEACRRVWALILMLAPTCPWINTSRLQNICLTTAGLTGEENNDSLAGKRRKNHIDLFPLQLLGMCIIIVIVISFDTQHSINFLRHTFTALQGAFQERCFSSTSSSPASFVPVRVLWRGEEGKSRGKRGHPSQRSTCPWPRAQMPRRGKPGRCSPYPQVSVHGVPFNKAAVTTILLHSLASHQTMAGKGN